MIFQQVYLLIQYTVAAILMFVIFAMALRLIFTYADPNPFGTMGKFAYWLRKKTEPLVRPIAAWLASARFDARIAPFVTMLVACVVGYFVLRLVAAVTMTLDGVIVSVPAGQIVAVVGYLLYGFLALLSLAIFTRIILLWVGIYQNRFARFLAAVTDWILVPFRRLVPPLGFLDISPMIVLFLIGFLQEAVAGTLIASGR